MLSLSPGERAIIETLRGLDAARRTQLERILPVALMELCKLGRPNLNGGPR